MSKLRNIGPTSQAWLDQIGIRTREDLLAVGAVLASLLMRQAGFTPSLNLRWALEGAILNKDWRDLTEAEKTRLRQHLAELER